MGSSPTYNWFLARSTDMEILAELTNATGRSISPLLNARESASFTLSILDKSAPLVQKVTTCVRCFRNEQEIWSGPVWTKAPSGAQGRMQVGCVGWFSRFNKRLLKTGSNPDVGPTPTTTATSMQYTNFDQCAIVSDLVARAVYDAQVNNAPVYVSMGNVPANTQTRNITYQQFQNIGQAITTLSQLEAGFDFHVDPTTRRLNLYYDQIWPAGSSSSTATVQGRGQVRPNALFGFKAGPNNLADVRPTEDAEKIENEVYAVGQYGTGEGTWPDAIQTLGLFSAQTSISDQVSTEILTSFAQAQAITNAYGITVYAFDQLPTGSPSTLQPFVDFDVGDFVYLTANYGSIKIPDPNAGFSGPQPVRIFGFEVNISDEGLEEVKNFQTVFTSQS